MVTLFNLSINKRISGAFVRWLPDSFIKSITDITKNDTYHSNVRFVCLKVVISILMENSNRDVHKKLRDAYSSTDLMNIKYKNELRNIVEMMETFFFELKVAVL